MPQGSGIVVMATDETEIRDNEIKNNESIGIAVVSYALIEPGGSGDPDHDPNPEGNWLHDNTLTNNGTDPKAKALIAVQEDGTAPQIFWDGRFDDSKDNSDGSLTNCIQGNSKDSGDPVAPQIVEGTTNCPDPKSQSKFCQVDCSGSAVDGVELPDRVWEMAGYDPSMQP
jgi:hypothetical protein